MDYSVKVLADSYCDETFSPRLTTIEATYPRFIHSEMLTHRQFSRNSASSRAIPTWKMIENVENHPVVPLHWGKNQSGMQAFEVVDGDTERCARGVWDTARWDAIKHAKRLNDLGIHKQIINRVLEPYMWITVIISGTEWSNFFALRCHKDAEPHMQHIAYMMRDAIDASTPKEIGRDGWHMPLMGFDGDESLHPSVKPYVSVGRCARVSYLTHDGKRDPQADLDLSQRLSTNKHMSPFEHVARPMTWPERQTCQKLHSNFRGWVQLRKLIPGECQ